MCNKMTSPANLCKDNEEVDLSNMDLDTFYEEYLKSDSDSDYDSDSDSDADLDRESVEYINKIVREELVMKELCERDLYEEDFCEQVCIEAHDDKYDVY